GVKNIDASELKSDYLINLDFEEQRVICIGSAGAFDEEYDLKLDINTPIENKYTFNYIQIEIRDLKGGHSGVEINTGRANSSKLLGYAVGQAVRNSGLGDNWGISSFVSGSQHNVIPNKGVAIVSIFTEQGKQKELIELKEKFISEIKKIESKLQKKWKQVEPNLKLIVTELVDEKQDKIRLCYTSQSSLRLLDSLQILPHGVLKLSPMSNELVETSINLAVVNLIEPEIEYLNEKEQIKEKEQLKEKKEEDVEDVQNWWKAKKNTAIIHLMGRSTDFKQLEYAHDQIQATARLLGATTSGMTNTQNAWEPDLTNPLLHIGIHCYTQVYKRAPIIYVVHAALECGILKSKKPSLKTISIGPTVVHVHSPQELLYVETVPLTYELTVKILENIK
ncbi:MAG: putative aminoacyl-histidine dipeptidase, partial [Streblomastix strix]